jgi:tRNA threonylcarbamoyl adenosine modification protein (Sua5/YciO/YrdC/YwlC family)
LSFRPPRVREAVRAPRSRFRIPDGFKPRALVAGLDRFQKDTTTPMTQHLSPAPQGQPAIGLVLANQDPADALRPALDLFREFECPCEVFVSSVWTIPERLLSWAERAESHGIRVIVAAAGAEPQLPGFLAAACRLPVIALPLATPRMSGGALLDLALHTAATAPVAAVAPGAAQEAALMAVRILALAVPRLDEAIEVYRQSLADEIAEQYRALTSESAPGAAQPTTGEPAVPRQPEPAPAAPAPAPPPVADFEDEEGEPVEIRPANLDRPLSGTPVQAGQPAAIIKPARMLGRMKIDTDAPDYSVIEEAIDCLLEGGVIAFPTETVYGLAADATNPAAVEKLYELKGRPRNKAITLMVDSPKLLGHIACNLTVEARRLMEAFWPGPLTIIFQKRGANFAHVSDRETIGVRLPDHSVPLAIMQALARPIACTSANLAGQPECFTADEVERAFNGKLNLIMDGGPLELNQPSTVIDVSGEPYRILRQGAVTRAQIAAVVGDKLDME